MHEPEGENILVLCVKCKHRYVTSLDDWENQNNECGGCGQPYAQRLSERVSEE
jgi:PHP family Zn ribbon phosphoesterase